MSETPEGPALEIERYATSLAIGHGLSQVAAELVAEKGSILIERALEQNPELAQRAAKSPAILKAYIRTTITRLARRHQAQEQSALAALRDHERIEHQAGPDRSDDDQIARLVVHQALERSGLTSTQRKRLLAYMTAEGNNVSAIARTEGVSEGAVRKSILAAMEKIRNHLVHDSSSLETGIIEQIKTETRKSVDDLEQALNDAGRQFVADDVTNTGLMTEAFESIYDQSTIDLKQFAESKISPSALAEHVVECDTTDNQFSVKINLSFTG